MLKRSLQIVAIVLMAACLMAADEAEKPAEAPAEGPSTRSSSDTKLIAEMNDYYARRYSQPLTQKSRFARLIAVMSLSKIDAPPLTKALVGLAADEDNLVAQIDWEALHARQGSLTPEERKIWLDGGMATAHTGGFPGATAAPLLQALSERPAADNKGLSDFLLRVANTNDPSTEYGKIALQAARDAIAKWQDPKVVRILITKMKDKNSNAKGIAFILGGLPGAPAGEDPGPWTKYENDMKLTPPASFPKYEKFSTVFPPAEKIEDPHDAKWRKDLELENLKLDTVEIVYGIDATPSMAVSNPYVSAYVETISQLFNMLNYNVRSGAVYYRHEIDPSIEAECCKKWEKYKDKGDFAVKILPLTGSAAELVGKMKAMPIGGRGTGHMGKGAWCAGVATAMTGMGWQPKSKRIIAMTGDAELTPGSDAKLLELAKKAKAEGYLLFFIPRDPWSAKVVAEASQAAMGMEPIQYGDDIKKIKDADPSGKNSAITSFEGTAFEEMTIRALEQSVSPGYRDRVRPLVTALEPILHARIVTGERPK